MPSIVRRFICALNRININICYSRDSEEMVAQEERRFLMTYLNQRNFKIMDHKTMHVNKLFLTHHWITSAILTKYKMYSFTDHCDWTLGLLLIIWKVPGSSRQKQKALHCLCESLLANTGECLELGPNTSHYRTVFSEPRTVPFSTNILQMQETNLPLQFKWLVFTT